MLKTLGAAGAFALLILAPACTDLTENPQSAITPENFYRNEDEVIGGLASVYAQLRTTDDEYYNTSEVSTDELIVPTRGQDWYDNGKWLDIHRQTFTPTSPAGLDNINSAWVNMFQGVARANVVLNGIANTNFASKATVTAELRVLRAWYYFLLMDLFGGVPIATDPSIEARPQASRDSVFRFVEAELKASRADLPVSWPSTMNGRVTKGAVDAILASLYLNAQIFSGTPTATGITPGAARWADAITEANLVINSGVYQLATNATAGCSTTGCGWRSNFTADNYKSPEIIFAVKYLNQSGLGLNFLMRTLHYNQYDSPAPWNGFSTLADTYAAFDPADQRTQIFLAGPQINLVTGQPAKDRQNNPLVFDPNIPDVTAATEGQGVRVDKWPVDPNHVQQDNGNDYAFFRLAEMYLIRAEANNELGNTAAAIADLNLVRARAFSPPKPTTAVTQAQVRDAILNERLFEFTWEGKRRQDLVRAGKFTSGTWYAKTTSTPFRALFPIPQTQIETNPQLKQNPGY
ncbi:MAG: RagB/SusD family nutrient uptake outer membrane protein [Gemmatimonadaceae bacterium]